MRALAVCMIVCRCMRACHTKLDCMNFGVHANCNSGVNSMNMFMY